MKKTLIALMALAGVASADMLNYGDAAFKSNAALMNGVIASYDFNTHGNNLVSDYSLNVWGGQGVGEIPGAFTTTEAGYADVVSNSVYRSNMGSEFANGGTFTVAFDLVSSRKGGDWGAVIALYSNSHGAQAGWRNALSIRNQGGADTNLFLSLRDSDVAGYDGRTEPYKIDTGINVKSDTLTSIVIVSTAAAEGETYGTLTLYIDGVEKGKVTEWNAKSLVGINFGGLLGGTDKAGAGTYIDNLTIWNTALSADSVKSLTIPEPTTATLSLLALAGLAARRRRK